MKDREAQEVRPNFLRRHKWLVGLAVVVLALGAGVGTWLFTSSTGQADEGREPPEAPKVLAEQAKMPFQILIPSYLPKEFQRELMEIDVQQQGPAGEPMVQLTYKTEEGATLFLRQWVPGNPEMEVLASSRPIETKWGKGWLLAREDINVVWVDVGPLRVSVFTPDPEVLAKEQVLAFAESLGPASNRQVFTFIVETPKVAEVEPPKPFEVPVNEQGVQEVTLVVTPGGYDPLRFAVKKGVPVKLIFREIGEVGCGNELIFPSDPSSPAALRLDSPDDQEVLEFTPQQAGEFEFYCGHRMYRGILTVHP